MRTYIVLIALLILGCNKQEQAEASSKEAVVYTVAPDIVQAFPDGQRSFASGADYYSDKNFIIDETGRIFFYGRRKYPRMVCGEDVSDGSVPIPEFINLHPAEIIELPRNSIEDFIRLNTPTDEREWNFPVIASARDTFSSVPLEKLLTQAYKHKKAGHIIRRMTEEEKLVMRYKKSGERYDPDRITWDTIAVSFPKPLKQ